MIPRDPVTVTVTTYHLCPHGATGSALGPYERVTYWWASPLGIRLAGDLSAHEREQVSAAVLEAIGASEADHVRVAQDLAAERPD